MSPALLDRYLVAAARISRLAVGDPAMKPVEEQYTPPREPPSAFRRARRNERVSDDLPFDSRGGLSVRHYFPLDAEYLFRIKFPGNSNRGQDPWALEFRAPVKAGLHTVGATFLRESAKPEAEAPPERASQSRPPVRSASVPPAQLDLRLDGAGLKRFEVPCKGGANVDFSTLAIAGPYNAAGPGQTPSRARIFVCRPSAAADEDPCARTILSSLARRAFRRPVTDGDLDPLLAFYRRGRAEGGFENGIRAALEALLVSADFLFRAEPDPPGLRPGTVYRLGGYELASRLSFFLWSSIPDESLLELAAAGRLHDPAVLEQQVRRMLDDPRSGALIANFTGQWLQLRNLASVKPDPEIFREFDESLRRALQQETEMLFASVLREDRSVLDLLRADYTWLNQRLAEHYGVYGIYGSQFRRVPVRDPHRAGLLGHAAILTVTSYPNRTSVVQRGRWVMDNLLGTPPPPPPPDIPELKPHAGDGRPLTMREQMQQHRANSTCAACHARMDPIGFALENYDAIGRWRESDAGTPIDATGKLPGGAAFQGPAGLRQLLVSRYREDFAATVAEKLLTYALGRGLEYYDKPAVRAITRQSSPFLPSPFRIDWAAFSPDGRWVLYRAPSRMRLTGVPTAARSTTTPPPESCLWRCAPAARRSRSASPGSCSPCLPCGTSEETRSWFPATEDGSWSPPCSATTPSP